MGLGIVSVRQLTREAESAMRESNEVLYASDAIGIEGHLRTLCDRVTEVYVSTLSEGEERLPKYNKIAARVLDAALDHPPVTFAIAGHPLVFVYPTQQILKVADDLGLRVKVLPGISSMDTMFIDLELDPGTLGVQMYETTGLLLQRRVLQPDVPCFLWQVGSVETRLFTRSPSLPHRFARLQAYLTRVLPARPPGADRLQRLAPVGVGVGAGVPHRRDAPARGADPCRGDALPAAGGAAGDQGPRAGAAGRQPRPPAVGDRADVVAGRGQRRTAVASASRVAR